MIYGPSHGRTDANDPAAVSHGIHLGSESLVSAMDYEASLDRAMDSVPDLDTGDSRLDVPDAEAQKDGAFTRLTNLGGVADALSRETEHLHRVIQRDLGTNGQFGGDRARYNGSFSAGDFDTAIDDYIEEFVICSECGLPDTRLEMEGRTRMLRCEACGAFRPVAKNTGSQQSSQQPDVEEGRTYEVKITGKIGRAHV